MSEAGEMRRLYNLLVKQKKHPFPLKHQKLGAPTDHGVYVIRCSHGLVMHVGRSMRAKNGMKQRLSNHLQGQSSFVKSYLGGNGEILRDGYTYQCLKVPDARARALLEHLAVGVLCPEHLGLGSGEKFS